MIADHATWTAGAGAVPLNPSAHPREVRGLLADAGASLLIGGGAAAPVAGRLGLAFVAADGAPDGGIEFDGLAPDGGGAFRPVEVSAAGEPAVLL